MSYLLLYVYYNFIVNGNNVCLQAFDVN